MSDDNYFMIQISIVCALSFLVGVTAISQHPQWFG